MIDPVWSTERLSVRDTTEEDLPQLQRVVQSNRATLLLDGVPDPDPEELRRWLSEGDLPPNGRKERYRLQTISRQDNGEAIGYLSLYHGHPDRETLYLASFFIRQDCQCQGFGGEIVDRIPHLAGLKDYPQHRLVVSVRNWGAVRFWTRHGFTTIARVIGNLREEDGSSARLELLRNRNVG